MSGKRFLRQGVLTALSRNLPQTRIIKLVVEYWQKELYSDIGNMYIFLEVELNRMDKIFRSLRHDQFVRVITLFLHSPFLNVTKSVNKSGMLCLVLAPFFLSLPSYAASGGAYAYLFPPKGNSFYLKANTVIGHPRKHIVTEEDTLLDIARNYKLGFNEMADLYPEVDAWVPPPGKELVIPTQWVLPDREMDGIVINIAELRLYYFMKKMRMVRTYPIGIGRQGWRTPTGSFRISTKRVNPAWYVPKSLQKKYNTAVMPAGPDNPLGDYMMNLSNSDYGVHGTNFPWAVGRLVTHGCIRLYPEDIKNLFGYVQIGTPVEIIYAPIKFGYLSGSIYVEVHRDIYKKFPDFEGYGHQLLKEKKLVGMVDMKKFEEALVHRDGLPVNITLSDDDSIEPADQFSDSASDRMGGS
jgi:L,D-transpeptidase ErfK/SrfK